MTTTAGRESRVNVSGAEVQMFSGGQKPVLLYLHGAGGNAGWQDFHGALTENYTVYAPSLPGFNGTPRPEWISSITDMAHFTLHMIETLGFSDYVLMGSSMGGWLAAEIAAMDHHNIKGLVLIDAAGIRPKHGEIAEIFMVSGQTRAGLRFHDPSQVPNYEQLSRDLTPEEAAVDHANREMASRLCWKPYLHNPSLPHYLGKVKTPTLVVWGRQDAIIPVECADLYANALPNATVKIIDNCGHSPQVEKPAEFSAAVDEFLAGLG